MHPNPNKLKQSAALGILLLSVLLMPLSPMIGQDFVGSGNLYPLEADGNKYVVSGFTPFSNQTDETIFAKALLWTVENICPKQQESITRKDVKGKSFSCDLVLESMVGSGLENTYYCRATFRIADGKLVFYLSDVLVESSTFVMKKVTPLEKLTPEKKASHKQTMEDFVQVESFVLNKMFDYVATFQLPTAITHWEEINARKPVKGMTEVECKLAFGKPQTVLETNGEIQWMYSSSFYLFFKNGLVQTIIK